MASEKRASTLQSAARTIAESRPRHRDVLVVEANPDLQWSLARMLTVDGNRVVGTSSGEGALAVVEYWGPDLALVASDLPGATGVEVAQQLRLRKPNLLVILMGEAAEPTGRLAHVSAYLPRPFGFDALRSLIESLQLTPTPAE
jgi:CheY-like chemotaxis protein